VPSGGRVRGEGTVEEPASLASTRHDEATSISRTFLALT
jgi:hypothetical protein